MIAAVLAIISLVVNLRVDAHSWLECSDYQDNIVAPYVKSKCRGFPRAFQRQYAVSFGVDTGFNNLDHTTKECPTPYADGLYDDTIKMAVYVPGQVINMVWPAKNHVAADCPTFPNRFIPDGGIKLLRSSAPLAQDYSISVPMNGEPHVFGEVDFKGFQRCFNFCDDKDKSPCYQSFTLDNDFTESGIYTFKWLWTFNEGEYYLSCFDAMVSIDGSVPQSNNTNGSGSGSGITFPPSMVPTPVVSTMPPSTMPPSTMPPSTMPSPVPSVPMTEAPSTESPAPVSPNLTAAPIISSGAIRDTSFIAHFISGMINITGWINETIYQ